MASCMNNLFHDHHKDKDEMIAIKAELEKIIAFVNPKSGGQKGDVIFEKLKRYLKEEQVFDLSEGGPKFGLEKNKEIKGLKILACGGDGTVGWVLSEIDKINFKEKPAVGIIPLGTGNDLARSLHWGGGYSNESVRDILKKLIDGTLIELDRWMITTNLNFNAVFTKSDAKSKLPLNVMNNYFSIGTDAKIALEFHLAREKDPAAFHSQVMNKLKYVELYSKDVAEQSCRNLRNYIEIFECDGEDMLSKLKDHSWHSLLFLNIQYYSGGREPWKNDSNSKEQSCSDGNLEIIGFQTIDFLLLQMGRPGDKIGQAQKIYLKTKESLPMQIDGEPVLLEPSEITISLKNRALMIDSTKAVYTHF